MNNLQRNIDIRRPLVFRDGKFRILCVSDMHGVGDYDTRIIRDFNALLDYSEPDFVFALGDMVWRDCSENIDAMKSFCDDFFGVLEERKIPWSYTFGNHDCNTVRQPFDQREVYGRYYYCVNKESPEGVYGQSNYVLPVRNSQDELVFNIWSLDTHDTIGDYCAELGIPTESKWDKECVLPLSMRSEAGFYDTVRPSQVMWYYNSSVELEKYAGHKVPGLLGMHMCLPEYALIPRNPAHLYFGGNMRETPGSSPLNSGLFSFILDRGDIKHICAGHDHINDYSGRYYGIGLEYDGGLNYDGYCDDDMRGGRIYEISEDDPWNVETYMIRSADVVAGYPGKCARKSGAR